LISTATGDPGARGAAYRVGTTPRRLGMIGNTNARIRHRGGRRTLLLGTPSVRRVGKTGYGPGRGVACRTGPASGRRCRTIHFVRGGLVALMGQRGVEDCSRGLRGRTSTAR